MDQKQIPQPVGFQAPPTYDQHQNYPQHYPGQPGVYPQNQAQIVTGKMSSLRYSLLSVLYE